MKYSPVRVAPVEAVRGGAAAQHGVPLLSALVRQQHHECHRAAVAVVLAAVFGIHGFLL